MDKVEITIIGAGVAGLAAAYELSKVYKDILIIEKNSSFGQETSSRNSEVIHAGIYYPRDSLKARTCIEGRRLLYDFCRKNNVSHKRIGKLIVAINKDEINDLENLFKKGIENGVEDLKFLYREEVKKIEPYVEAQAAVYSPCTGIMDSHSLMKALVSKFKSQRGDIIYNTEVVGIEKVTQGYKIYLKDKRGESFNFLSRLCINCAGLNSDKVAKIAGIDRSEYTLKYCKGDYFRVHNNKAKFISRLIYPVPKKDRAGLGIHATLDLGNSLRLGPDDEYIKEISYDIDKAKQKSFYESVRCFLPFIEFDDLTPDTSGIRPKLQGQGENFRDFIIKDEADNGLKGFINLIGIESPGFTAAFSIAKLLKEISQDILS